MGRSWWPGITTAATLTYDNFPDPMDVPSSPGTTLPNAAGQTTVTAGQGQITVTFGSSVTNTNPSSAITGYLATCTSSAGSVSATGQAPSIVVAGLTAALPYNCSVQAQNSVGNSIATTPATATPTTLYVPGPPTLTLASYYSNISDTLMTFTAPSSNGTAPITNYLGSCIGPSPASTSYTAYSGSGSELALAIPLSQGGSYSCYVQAINSNGLSANSNSMSVTVP